MTTPPEDAVHQLMAATYHKLLAVDMIRTETLPSGAQVVMLTQKGIQAMYILNSTYLLTAQLEENEP
jgi:hypothetical protein